jgi:hypothetical protein
MRKGGLSTCWDIRSPFVFREPTPLLPSIESTFCRFRSSQGNRPRRPSPSSRHSLPWLSPAATAAAATAAVASDPFDHSRKSPSQLIRRPITRPGRQVRPACSYPGALSDCPLRQRLVPLHQIHRWPTNQPFSSHPYTSSSPFSSSSSPSPSTSLSIPPRLLPCPLLRSSFVVLVPLSLPSSASVPAPILYRFAGSRIIPGLFYSFNRLLAVALSSWAGLRFYFFARSFTQHRRLLVPPRPAFRHQPCVCLLRIPSPLGASLTSQ